MERENYKKKQGLQKGKDFKKEKSSFDKKEGKKPYPQKGKSSYPQKGKSGFPKKDNAKGGYGKGESKLAPASSVKGDWTKKELPALTIKGYDNLFNGVARFEGHTYHVKGAIDGEKVSVIRDKEFEYNCRVFKVLSASPKRVKSPCRFSNRCGSCSLLHIDYQEQLSIKRNFVQNKLKDFNVEVNPCVGKEKYMRNKVHFAFHRNASGVNIGFIDETGHNVVDIPTCIRHGDFYKKVYRCLRDWIVVADVDVYIPKYAKGNLRFAVARCFGDNLSLTLVTREKKVEKADLLYSMLSRQFRTVSLWQNVNAEYSNKVFSKEFYHLDGEEKLSASICGIKFSLAPDSFFQTNTDIAQQIYQTVAKEAEVAKPSRIIDAFCGIGVTSALFANISPEVIGLEIVPSSIENAKELAKNNGCENLTFIQGDVGEELAKLPPKDNTLIFLDPPRMGLGEGVCKALLSHKPERIIYLSCNPETLAEDLKLLANDYAITSVTPYDMFPYAHHVESLVCLTRSDKAT